MRGVALVVAAAAALIVAVGGVRALMPQTACNVSYAQYKALPMKVSYDKAKGLLGCDGKLLSREEYDGKLVIESYAWRGAAWLYGRVEAVFINNSLEKKSLLRSDLVSHHDEAEATDVGLRHPALR